MCPVLYSGREMTVVLLFFSFVCGAFAVLSHSWLAREFLVVFLAGEMSLAALVFGWSAGAAGGARAGRVGMPARVGSVPLLSMCLLTWMVALPAVLLAVRMSRSLMLVEVEAVAGLWKLLVVSVAFVAPVSAFAGFVFSVLARLWRDLGARRPVSLLYVAEVLGGACGGGLFSFVLAGRVTPFAFAFMAYVPLGVTALVIAVSARRAGRLDAGTCVKISTGAGLLGVAGAVVALSGSAARLDLHSHIARMATLAPGVVMDTANSRYRNLTVNLHEGRYTLYSNGQAVATFPEPLQTELEAHLVAAQQGRARKVLVIGGGLEFAAALVDAGIETVDYVESDAEAVAVTLDFIPHESVEAYELGRFAVHWEDPVEFVARAAAEKAGYDCVFIRPGAPSTLLVNMLYTREFYESMRGALREDAVVAVPVSIQDGDPAAEVAGLSADIYATLASVFDDVLATPGERSIFIAAGQDGILSTDEDELTERFEARGVSSALYPEAFRIMLPPGPTLDLNDSLRELDGRVNTDNRPVTFRMQLERWAAASPVRSAMWLAAVVDVPWWAGFAAAILAGAAVAHVICGRGRAAAAERSALFCTGWAIMGMVVVLLFAFQSARGAVYEEIGMFWAVFLSGAALGAIGGAIAAGTRRGFIVAELAVPSVSLLTFGALAVLTSRPAGVGTPAILFLVGMSGAVGGFAFSVLSASLEGGCMDAAEAAGKLKGADLAGASAGALLGAMVIVPMLGMQLALLAVAAVKLVCSAVALWHGRSLR